jgi:hypothetical protein
MPTAKRATDLRATRFDFRRNEQILDSVAAITENAFFYSQCLIFSKFRLIFAILTREKK